VKNEPGRFVVRYLWRQPAELLGTVIPDEQDTHGVLALMSSP